MSAKEKNQYRQFGTGSSVSSAVISGGTSFSYFLKEYEEIGNNVVRTRYGMLASVVGIFCNVLLFLIKISIGFVLRSISVMADAFNNLSDAGSSIISFVGVRIASKPADKDHPFGHGRIEYISALVVSFLVIEVGFTFLKDAIQKIKHPQEMHFQLISVIILLLSVEQGFPAGYVDIFRGGSHW